MEKDYIPRIFDKTLEFALQTKGAVLVVGPKWCGKTRTCSRHAKTIIEMLPIDKREDYEMLAKNSPSKFLNYGEKPILIDEWQIISFIWNSIKEEVDKNSVFGQYILTGSVTDKFFIDDVDKNYRYHTANGRIIRKLMRTMSLYESKDSTGEVSLLNLQKGVVPNAISQKDIDDYAFLVCRGGWPLAIGEEKDVALQQAKDYFDILYQDDIFSLRDLAIRKNTNLSLKFLKSYSRNIGTQCSDNTIIEDLGINLRTFGKYFQALQRLFVIDEVSAWNTNLRSKIAIRTRNTRYFVDPSIAAACLKLTPESLFKNMKYFGFLFQSLAIRDLRIYAEANGGSIYHYRDSQDREVDAVIVYGNGDFALVEIKMGGYDEVGIAAKKLITISEDLVEKPIYMMVVTATKFAYKRDDGVYVVPLATLKD